LLKIGAHENVFEKNVFEDVKIAACNGCEKRDHAREIDALMTSSKWCCVIDYAQKRIVRAVPDTIDKALDLQADLQGQHLLETEKHPHARCRSERGTELRSEM
jgi:hypothetical protein